MGLGALGAIAGGINRGMDWAQRDQEIADQRKFREEDREYQRGIRGFQQQQNQRTLEEQGRQDVLASEMSKIKPAGTEYEASPAQVDMTTGEAVPAVKKTQTEVGVARQQAKAYNDARQYDKAAERWKWADEAASKNAAQRYMSALKSVQSTGKSMSLFDMAKALAGPIDDDESPVGVDRDSITEGPGGSVSVRVFNKNTGHSQTLSFTNKSDLQRALMYHVAPDYAQELEKREQDALNKIAEERAKGVVIPAGGQFLPGEGDKRPAAANYNRLVWNGQYNPDGTPQMVPPERSSGSGSGSKSGKKEDAPNSPYMSAIDDMIKTTDVKFASPDEAAQVRTIADTFASGFGYDTSRIPPNVAMRAALNYVRGGGQKAESIGVDPATGAVRREYNDPEYGPFSLGQFNGKLTQGQRVDLAQKLLSQQGYDRSGKPMERLIQSDDGSVKPVQQTPEQIAQYQKQLRAAAFDQTGPGGTSVVRRQLEDDIRSQVDLAAREAIAKNPNASQQVKQAAAARVNQEIQILGRKLDLIRGGMSAEKATGDFAQPQTRAEVISRAGGLTPKVQQIASDRAKVVDAANAADMEKRQKELEEGRARAERNKQLRNDAAAITADVINDPRLSLKDLMDLKAKYDMVMDGRQREVLYSRIDQMRRKAPLQVRQ